MSDFARKYQLRSLDFTMASKCSNADLAESCRVIAGHIDNEFRAAAGACPVPVSALLVEYASHLLRVTADRLIGGPPQEVN